MIDSIDFKPQNWYEKEELNETVNDKNNTLNYNNNMLICVLNKLSPWVNGQIYDGLKKSCEKAETILESRLQEF